MDVFLIHWKSVVFTSGDVDLLGHGKYFAIFLYENIKFHYLVFHVDGVIPFNVSQPFSKSNITFFLKIFNK